MMLLCISPGRPWEYFLTVPGDSNATANQMCKAVIIASCSLSGMPGFSLMNFLSLVTGAQTLVHFERQVSGELNVSIIGVFVAPTVYSSPAANLFYGATRGQRA